MNEQQSPGRPRKHVNNSTQWRKLSRCARRWAENARERPSFICLYWNSKKGQMVWEGTKHMRPFVEDEAARKKFLEAALSQSILPDAEKSKSATSRNPLLDNPIKLVSKGPSAYPSKVLYKIIPRIVDPGGREKPHFWLDPSNKPTWWPKHTCLKKQVPFKAPNHPSGSSTPGKMTSVQMRKILKEFILQCPDITGEADSCSKLEDSSSCSSDHETERDTNLSDSNVEEQLEKPETSTINSSIQSPFSPKVALGLLSSRTEWSTFKTTANDILLQADKTIGDLDQFRSTITATDIPQKLRLPRRRGCPKGYTAAYSTPDANCLFNAVSTAICGTEELGYPLRLASVLHGIGHFQHYIDMLKTELSDVDRLQQFICTVASSDVVFEGRPQDNPTVDDLIAYIMKEEIQTTSKVGSYSGLIQVLLLAGALKRPIQQFSDPQIDAYNILVVPCGCCDNMGESISVLWTTVLPSSTTVNHILPLLPTRGNTRCAAQTKLSLAPAFDQVCMASRHRQCTVERNAEWVQCTKCQGWYHCQCVGLAPQHVEGDLTFSCCSTDAACPNPETFTTTVVNKVQVTLRDVQSLYPNRGISDAVIDLYTKEMLPKCETVSILRALTYTSISNITAQLEGTKRVKIFTEQQVS